MTRTGLGFYHDPEGVERSYEPLHHHEVTLDRQTFTGSANPSQDGHVHLYRPGARATVPHRGHYHYVLSPDQANEES